MPTGVADLSFVATQVLEKLHASPRAARYTLAIGEDSEYVVLQEVKDFVLLADEQVIQDILSTPGHGWRSGFMVQSSALNSGDFLPNFIGKIGDVSVAVSSVYKPSTPAKSREEILRMIEFPSLYTNKRFHYCQDGMVYTPGDSFKAWYPAFTRTSACQSPQTAEAALIYGAIEIAEKINSETEFFKKYSGLFQVARQYVRDEKIIPPQEELERMLAVQRV